MILEKGIGKGKNLVEKKQEYPALSLPSHGYKKLFTKQLTTYIHIAKRREVKKNAL